MNCVTRDGSFFRCYPDTSVWGAFSDVVRGMSVMQSVGHMAIGSDRFYMA